ncbi:MAG TPA: hypothetical protein VGX28_01600 [Frankiaceae bacterium]|nr:hypothetical protein [Frankiaceae bacterium]
MRRRKVEKKVADRLEQIARVERTSLERAAENAVAAEVKRLQRERADRERAERLRERAETTDPEA